MNSAEQLKVEIESDEYLRQRYQPRVGDPLYLHLSDLLLGMNRVATTSNILLLDFGCGGSPYRQLFPEAQYRRADYLETEGLDYLIKEDSLIDERSELFDFVLSTQVLEHARNPQSYLTESYRLLKPGGSFVCTTHGTYEEHGCPFDFQRWTADGLKAICEDAGYQIQEVVKLTTGVRALLFLFELYRTRFGQMPDHPLSASLLGLLQSIHNDQATFHQWCDAVYSDHRVTASFEREHAFYIALMLVAKKSETKGDTRSATTSSNNQETPTRQPRVFAQQGTAWKFDFSSCIDKKISE